MRKFPPRPKLPHAVERRLATETKAISKHRDPKSEAERRYSNARKAKWFQPIVKALIEVSRPARRCMFCSGNEASDVEHYRPKAVFPLQAMVWGNYLWACSVCNRGKSNHFPPDTEPGGRLINPMGENVWQFFFIDNFGLLTARYDTANGALDERAATTLRVLSLNREAVQECRQMRIRDLRERVIEALDRHDRGDLTKDALRGMVSEWRSHPFQPDVADYFLNGPGRSAAPFESLFQAIE